MLKDIIIKGAREHNLKNIDVTIPRNKLTVITGLSGSGKSSLAFDTIYAEGQRRYVESLSAYARQFLGLMQKPDLDSIEGLSPAISIEQKTTSKNPRSTVGTVTEIYDYLRLIYARIGIAHCPKCDSKIQPQSAENIVNLLLSEEKEIMILAPLVRGLKGTYEKLLDDIKKEGYTRIRVDGQILRVDETNSLNLERYEKHWIEIVIDRLVTNQDNKSRLTEAVEHALAKGNETIIVIDKDTPSKVKEIERAKYETVYSSFGACPNHPEIVFEQLEPRMFSFNSPFGACHSCHGIGERLVISEELVVPDKSKSIIDGAIKVYGRLDLKWRSQQLAVVGKKFGFDLFMPIKDFSKQQLDVLFYGSDKKIDGNWSNGASMSMDSGFEGVINQTTRLYSQTESPQRKEFYEKFMVSKPCNSCNGMRLRPKMLAVKINSKSIIDVTDMSIAESKKFFEELEQKLSDKERFIAKQVLKEIKDRLLFLYNVGLDYLTLSRTARTLSGGEAQRIRLATQIGANLMGVLYVLDEPSIGLHQRDNEKLLATLKRLRDLGNTLIVVEHDEDTMFAADHIIDMGPGAGIHGGEICAFGSPDEVANSNTLTGKYLSKKIKIETPKKYRESKESIKLFGATQNNLKNIDVEFPTRILCSITGVSGSGKSTLMTQTLIPALKKELSKSTDFIDNYKSIKIPSSVRDILVIDQEPIGKTPRSNPATYTKLFDDIRALFAKTKEAKTRGYKPGRFSFNVKGGRCETCKGDGQIKIEMNFLPDVFVKCDDCQGKRYNKETLQVTYKSKNIADVLAMSVEEALSFFENHSSMKRKLKTLFDVGLGYIKLGQSSTTLSGGESQRIKLTRELAKVKKGNTLYLLDEPTTGLHFEDIRKLIAVLNRLVDKGNTVYVIEHNLDVVKSSDYVIDLGPEGGQKGGKIIALGSPKEIANNKKSITGKFLKSLV
ncbi:MAG: excinuclease ABC subunit UvrA [Candidatus Woesearchaeota archaeon]